MTQCRIFANDTSVAPELTLELIQELSSAKILLYDSKCRFFAINEYNSKMTIGHNFHDINKFPKGYGIVVFPISIARAQNGTGQDPKQCLEYLHELSPSKVLEPKLGLNMIYGDFLYLHSNAPAASLRDKFMKIVLGHKKAFHRLVLKENQRFQIQQAFSYEVWNQLYLNYHSDFASDLAQLKKIYRADKLFQKYVREDSVHIKRNLDENQLNFFLEEHLMFYLITKKQVALPNEYVLGREEWVLIAYPGPPLKAQTYICQLDPLQLLAPENHYRTHFYDLEAKILTDLSKVDLEKYNYTYSG